MIRIIIKKLLKYNAAVITDLPELLDMLDKGYDVNISDMGDPYVRHKLYKLFKLFGVSHDTRNKYNFKRVQPVILKDPTTKRNRTMKEYALKLIQEYRVEESISQELSKPKAVLAATPAPIRESGDSPGSQASSHSKRVCLRPDSQMVYGADSQEIVSEVMHQPVEDMSLSQPQLNLFDESPGEEKLQKPKQKKKMKSSEQSQEQQQEEPWVRLLESEGTAHAHEAEEGEERAEEGGLESLLQGHRKRMKKQLEKKLRARQANANRFGSPAI